ncbi:acetolactate synthase [Salinisphaera orenii MK-B5]|uniref:Acetolactate synthase n=1 Tax=Salinisphaera orenii MK-B5 TaxID=856730 RepID=A0A423PMH6_9GAMM|nr:thiamine pyrophosphate-dependent enzyme [Salinisphaera orenii]ROO26824.1 acetolactate synthase [Salinisphaera orenii MK-B5]
MAQRHAGQVIVDALARHGVPRVYSVPGESFLAVLDGLYESAIETIVCRQEGGAGYMAEAHGKLTGEPGVALVTRGPGAANAMVAVHAAWQDATPMVLFVGLIPTAHRQREAFQAFDIRAWFGTQAKRVFVLDCAERAGAIVAEAFHAARAGRPGPVVVGLPEDVVSAAVAVDDHPVLPVAEGGVSAADRACIRDALAGAERPLLFIGGPRWTATAAAAVTAFAERYDIPVVHDWRASDRIPFDSPVNVGWLGYGRGDHAARLLADADVLLSIGALPTDVPSDGYTLRQSMQATHIAVHIDPELRGRSGALTHHVLAAPTALVEALAGLDPSPAVDRTEWRADARAAQAAFAELPALSRLPETAVGTVHMTRVVAEVVARLPADAIHCFGAGNHCFWAQRYLPTRVFPSQLSLRNGSMGYSVPAAVAASLECPERTIVAIAGDGEFSMNGQELATAVQHGAAMLVVVMDNRQFATIRAHQEARFPGRISGTRLHNPDFAALGRAYGGHGETVTADDQAAPAVERALAVVQRERRPAVVHVHTDQRFDAP